MWTESPAYESGGMKRMAQNMLTLLQTSKGMTLCIMSEFSENGNPHGAKCLCSGCSEAGWRQLNPLAAMKLTFVRVK